MLQAIRCPVRNAGGRAERRSEIGLRRALGATRALVAVQFLAESLLGGMGGVALGAAATAGYALAQGLQVVVRSVAVAGGLGAALVVGAIAGLYPATRAVRLAPTQALRSVWGATPRVRPAERRERLHRDE